MQKIRNIDQRHKRLVELNVQESCINLFANPIVQKKQASSSTPRIHGWVYDIETGLLNKLEIDFKVSRSFHRVRLCRVLSHVHRECREYEHVICVWLRFSRLPIDKFYGPLFYSNKKLRVVNSLISLIVYESVCERLHMFSFPVAILFI